MGQKILKNQSQKTREMNQYHGLILDIFHFLRVKLKFLRFIIYSIKKFVKLIYLISQVFWPELFEISGPAM